MGESGASTADTAGTGAGAGSCDRAGSPDVARSCEAIDAPSSAPSGDPHPARDAALLPFGARPPLIDAAQLASWILVEEEGLMAIAKPGWVVCHPSKHGPCSSLVGAVRALWGWETVHLISRLDRETSGLVLLARDKAVASPLQRAFMQGRVAKTYHALLCGHLPAPVEAPWPLADDPASPVGIKTRAWPPGSPSAKQARTRFVPLAWGPGHTLVRIHPAEGRKHQIRAHARALGRPVAGDKIYGPDDRLYLRFIAQGFDDLLDRFLPLPRQALHCSRLVLTDPLAPPLDLSAPLPEDFLRLALALLPHLDEAGLAALVAEERPREA